MKEKFVPQTDQLIYRHSGYGPVFGSSSGWDIYISDSCNTNNSQAYFPNGYNRAGENKLINNQESNMMFSGQTNGYDFKVLEYEVFKVCYQ